MTAYAATSTSINFFSTLESTIQIFESTFGQKQYKYLTVFRDELPENLLIKGVNDAWLPLFAALCEDSACPVDVILHFDAYTGAHSALEWAILKNRLDVVEELLKSLSEEEIHSTRAGERNLLHLITTETDLKIVRALLNKGISLDQRDCFGNTPAHTAAASNRLDVLDLYGRYRADLSAQNQAQESVFITWAVRLCLRAPDMSWEDFSILFQRGIDFFLGHFKPQEIFPNFEAKIPFYFQLSDPMIQFILEIFQKEKEEALKEYC